MPFYFYGTLEAYICTECITYLRGATVRLYRHRGDQKTDALVAARTKETFQVLSDEAVKAKAGSLLAEATADENGRFTIELSEDKHDYDGGAFEIDVRLAEVPNAKKGAKRAPVQFTITSVQPEWKETNKGLVYHWRYCIAARLWCYILSLFDVWVICGTVLSAKDAVPVGGLTVRAYDRDWLQDDLLGDDVTDVNGKFRIYYTSSDFKKTPFSPFINTELTIGPDLYFEIETSGGNLVLDESPQTGRIAGRENVGHCFCITLRVDAEATPPYDAPLFTNVGNFHILSDIDATGLANKSKAGAGGVGFGFFGSTKLRGFCPKTKPGTADPMYYRFLYVDPDTAVEKPVVGGMLTSVLVGSKLVWWDLDSDGVFGWTFQDIYVAGSGATPPVSGGTGPVPAHVITPDPVSGWVAVDQDGLDDGFYGPLVRLNTAALVPGGSAPGSGASQPPADPKNGKVVEILFETTTDPSNPAATDRQTDTATILVNNWAEVRQIDLQEFQTGAAGACTGLTTQVTVLYTVDHELIADWSVGMSSAASPWSAPALPSGNTPRGGNGSQVVNIATWPPCSYIVSLTARRKLTDGELNDDGDVSLLSFCKT